MKTLLRWVKRLAVVATILGIVGLVVGAYAYKRWVVDDPGPHITRAAIDAIIAQESPVLYRDGSTRIGVLFAEEHRQYVPYRQIPRAWVDAIIAAEDDRYWDHPGIDWHGVLRAFVKNVQAGHVVAGGSTLTQQTAKNLFYRPDRSWKSKLEEAANALRLEAHFSKEEILEFYANQFHVSANGRGLGIAARYFFNVEPEQLTPLECAYLAGMVQAPARFNPFLAETEAEAAAARKRAGARTRYVLRRMHEEGSLDDPQFQTLMAEEIPFQRGAFRYDSSVLLDEVAARLEHAPFPELFAQLGIDNPSTAGVSVVTTLDPVAQREASYALSHHLTELGLFLEKGTVSSLLLPEGRAPARDPDNPPEVHTVVPARVRTATEQGLVLDLGGVVCVADRDALLRMATALARARSGNPHEAAKADDVAALVAALPTNTVLLASVRESGSCDLEFRPTLQGAVMLLETGQIRAMVGGSDNRNFNRAVTAKRQFGSTWKPLVYDAALQLGWAPTDALDNRNNAFPFEGSWYYPRPDHEPLDVVSLAWAGTRSENLASIWLLYHLTDRLEPEQFRAVAELVGMTPAPGEDREAYVRRIRDDLGIISTSDRADEYAFQGAKAEVLASDMAWPEDALALRSLLYGRGAEAEAARVRKAVGGDERARELGAVAVNFQRLEAVGEAAAVADHAEADPTVQAEDLLVEGRIHLGTLRAVRRAMGRLELVLAGADPYALDTLALHPDFRLLVNLKYVSGLAARLGLRTPPPPLLAMPLGAVDISLEDAAVLYQGISDGQAWSFPGTRSAPSVVPGLRSSDPVPSPDSATLLIAEIRDREGNVLYRARPVPDPVADPMAGRLVGDVLANVVQWGTGRRALGAVQLAGLPVPVAGKTGTTNSYKNAAFAGFVPVVQNGSWRWASGYLLAAYVGYDDNRPMKRGGTRIQGASGALPVWIGTAQGLAAGGLLGKVAPSEPGLVVESGLVRVPVDGNTGLPTGQPAPDLVLEPDAEVQPSVLVAGSGEGEQPERRFAPWASANAGLRRPEAALAGRVEAAPPPVEPVAEEGEIGVEEEAPAYIPELEEATEVDTGIVPRIAPPDEAPEVP